MTRIVRDKAVWDGRFTLRVDVSEGWFRSSSDSVPMAVAPLILHNHTERVTTLFASQGVQDPLKLDTSWLAIAHVDEFVQFLPADNARGWTIAVADPRAAVEVLRTTQAAGHGAVRASSRPDAPAVTVDQLLSDQKFLAGNTEAAEAIDRNLKILMDETGVKREEVVGVPALFRKDAFGFGSDGDELPGMGEPGPLPTAEDPAANTYAPDRPFDATTAKDSPIEYAQGSFAAYVPGAVKVRNRPATLADRGGCARNLDGLVVFNRCG